MKKLRILMLENNKLDAELINEKLTEHKFDFISNLVQTKKDFIAAILKFKPDIILSDYSLPQFTGFEALIIAKKLIPDIPFIIVTDDHSIETAVDSMKKGSWDYVLKNHLSRLIPAIENVLKLKEEKDKNRLAAEALKVSNENFQQLASITSTVVWKTDIGENGNFVNTYISPVADELLELPAGTIENDWDKYFSYIKPEYINQVNNIFREKIMSPGKKNDCEYEVLKDNGQSAWFYSIGRCFEKDGKLHVFGLTADITERKQAEQKLIESKNTAERYLNIAAGIILTLDSKGNITFLNESGHKLLGYKNGTLIGKNWFKTSIPESVLLEAKEVFSDLMSGRMENVETYENAIITSNGAIKDIFWHNSLLKDNQSRIIGTLSSGEDISERKLAEKALKESELRFRTIMEDIPTLAVQGYALDGTVSFWNTASELLYGYSSEETLGANLLDLIIPAEMKEEVTGAIQQMIESGAPIPSGELLLKHKDGSRVPVYSSHVLFNPINRQPEFFCLDIDLTKRKQVEEELKSKQAQLTQAQRMESVGRLAGGVAHDFNNMLGVILGHADLILEELDPALPIYAYLTEIRKAAQRSADLTRQLLAFARKQTVAPKVLNLNKTMEEMLQMLSRLIGEDIDLAWRPGKEMYEVNMDPSQIDQILANLCVNARDAIESEGRITIETGTAFFDEDYCSEHAGFVPGEFVMLAVSDDGCGMSKESLAQIFEPFFTTKELGKGTGLGLATIYGIVKQNNGFINVYSEPGQGTTFKIYLPRHIGKTGQIQEKDPAKPDLRGYETILLVEDEPAILKLTTRMLERLGYTVVAAGTPSEAIRMAAECAGQIHLLMTDVVMPGMNGRDLAKNLLSSYPNLKRLFMSGYTSNVIERHGVLEEGVHFIQKPFSMKDLGAKVHEIMGKEQ